MSEDRFIVEGPPTDTWHCEAGHSITVPVNQLPQITTLALGDATMKAVYCPMCYANWLSDRFPLVKR
jgi:hypothetical protein